MHKGAVAICTRAVVIASACGIFGGAQDYIKDGGLRRLNFGSERETPIAGGDGALLSGNLKMHMAEHQQVPALYGNRPSPDACCFRRLSKSASTTGCGNCIASPVYGSGRLASVGRPLISLLLWLDVGNNISLSLSCHSRTYHKSLLESFCNRQKFFRIILKPNHTRLVLVSSVKRVPENQQINCLIL